MEMGKSRLEMTMDLFSENGYSVEQNKSVGNISFNIVAKRKNSESYFLMTTSSRRMVFEEDVNKIVYARFDDNKNVYGILNLGRINDRIRSYAESKRVSVFMELEDLKSRLVGPAAGAKRYAR